MKKIINKSVIAAGLILGLLITLLSCEDSFDKSDIETNVPVSVMAFSINGIQGAIDQNAGQIDVMLPFGSDITSVIPQITLPEGATINIDMGSAINFTSEVKFRVVNGNLYKDYTVNAVVSYPITSFKIGEVTGIINNVTKTIFVTLPEERDLTALQPVITLSEGVTISPALGTTIDFTSPVAFTVTNGTVSAIYTVTVTVAIQGIEVAFLGTASSREGITNLDEKAACDWLFTNYGGARYISFDEIAAGVNMGTIDAVWWHYDSDRSLPQTALTPSVITALRTYRTNGGNLLLTTFASQYVNELGIVPGGKGPNNVFGDLLPAGGVDANSWGISFMGHEDHPIFQGLETFQTGKANLLQGGTYRLNHTAWWFLPEWGGYGDGAGWRSQTGGTNLASETWDDALNGRVTIAEWGTESDANVVVISMGAYDWYNEADASGNPSQPNSFIENIHTLTQNSINYLVGQ
jgi:hypothetical protein